MPSNFRRQQLFIASIILAVVAGLAVYYVNYSIHYERARKDLEENVELDLELRALRLRTFFEDKQTDLSVLSGSKEIHEYIKAFSRLSNPQFDVIKDYYNGVTSGQDEFARLYGSILDWGKSCIDYFTFQDLLIVNNGGDVVFSVARGSGFGANLARGLNSTTELGMVFQKVHETKGFYVGDFETVGADSRDVAVFMGAPVLENDRYLGTLIVQLPMARIQTEIGKRGSVNYKQLVLQSPKVTYNFPGFDSLQSGQILTKSAHVIYFDRRGQTLAASISEDTQLQIDPSYPIALGLATGLLVLLLGLFGYRIYLKHTRVSVSATNAMIVQSTWASIIDHPEKIGKDFYNNLFQIPEIAKVFKSLGHQPDLHKKLVSMMSMIVNHSDRMDVIETEIVRLAGMHVRIGVQPQFIAPFINAFIKTVEQQYDGEFSPKLRHAWFNVLNEVGRIFTEVIAKEREKEQTAA